MVSVGTGLLVDASIWSTVEPGGGKAAEIAGGIREVSEQLLVSDA